MHPRIDLALILCAFGVHDEVRVAERAIHPARTVLVRRCVRCSRYLRPRRTPPPARIDTGRPLATPSRYT